MEEMLIEMYLVRVSVNNVDDIIEALWSSKVLPSTNSELNKQAYVYAEREMSVYLRGWHLFAPELGRRI